MMARLLAVAALLFLVACGNEVNILPEPFTRERADGKIPVHAELIRKQERAVLDGMPEKEAEVARWQAIESDYNECRLSSARSYEWEDEEVFAVCMSQKGYVYMYPIDAEQFHNDIADELRAAKDAAERAAEERRLAAEKKAEEERIAAEKALPLIIAASKGNAEDVKLLLSEGANPNAANDDGETALMSAAFDGHAEVVKLLLSAGANPNVTQDDGWTALAYAVEHLHFDIAEILLEAKANPNHIVNVNNGYSVMDNVILDNHPDMVCLLRRYGGVCRRTC